VYHCLLYKDVYTVSLTFAIVALLDIVVMIFNVWLTGMIYITLIYAQTVRHHMLLKLNNYCSLLRINVC